MSKLTEETKKEIVKLVAAGSTLKEIAEKFNISTSTVKYHSSADYKKKSIARAIKNRKPTDRKEYNREYQANRYKNDPEYRERIKRDNRINQNKKYKEKNGKSNNLP